MRKLSLILLFLLCFSLVAAQDLEPYDARSIIIDGTITNGISIAADGRDPSIRSLTANISWFPQDREGQEVLFFDTVPAANVRGDAVVFSLDRPYLDDYSFDIIYQVKTHVDTVPVERKIAFPITRLENELVPFVNPTETIDSTPEIRSLAADLAGDNDDLFLVVSSLASWTRNNIEYDLSTISVEASQPASWVLENREGVCDEMTNLFIAMLRSLGIPARFVSGLAYTNSPLFSEPWGAHGWAEVYFPGEGWVPFDVTYNQLGWVDASHVVLATGVDGGTSGSSYSWLGRDVEIDVQGMEFETEIGQESGRIDPLLELSARPLEDHVALDSYQLVTVHVGNPSARYVADTIQLASVDGFSFIDEKFQDVVLAPGEETDLFWRLKLDGLQKGYVYTFPIIAAAQRGASSESSFAADPRSKRLSRDLVDRFVDASVSDGKPYDGDMLFACAADRSRPRVDEVFSVSCSLENEGDLSLEGVRVCLDAACETVDVAAGDAATIDFPVSFAEASLHGLSASATHELLDKQSFFSVDVVAPAAVRIQNLSAPLALGFDEVGTISFSLVPVGTVLPEDVTVRVEGARLAHEWSFSSLENQKSFELSLSGDRLSSADDAFAIVVMYVDDRGALQTVRSSFAISPRDLSWWQRLYLWVADIF